MCEELDIHIKDQKKLLRVSGGQRTWSMVDLSEYSRAKTGHHSQLPIELLKEFMFENSGKFMYVWKDVGVYQLTDTVIFLTTLFCDSHHRYLTNWMSEKGIEENMAWRRYGDFSQIQQDGIAVEFVSKNNVGWVMLDIDFTEAVCLTEEDCLNLNDKQK